MIYGLYNSAAGALVQDAKVNVISNNMANVKTTGFRKDFISFMDRRPESLENNHFEGRNEILDRMHGGVFIKGTPWDKSHGNIEQTGRDLDVAINGDGYFRVRGDGQEYLTRAGNFRLNNQNELVTMNGDYNVLNSEGEPIVVEQTGKIHFGEDGVLSVGGNIVDQLGLADVRSGAGLSKVGKVRFLNRGGAQNIVEFDGKIVHGALEKSNVSSVREMSNMIRAERAYGSNVKAMEIQDSTLQRAVNQVGAPPTA